jgi:hypothetical protein
MKIISKRVMIGTGREGYKIPKIEAGAKNPRQTEVREPSKPTRRANFSDFLLVFVHMYMSCLILFCKAKMFFPFQTREG